LDTTTITHLIGADTIGYENELFFYHGNHLSSTQMVTDINANVTQQVFYAPFGEVLSESNAYWHNGQIPDYLFNAKELDEENGMYYYSARYYAPPTFVSRDEFFEEYPEISPYAYCLNNPVKYIDPDGRKVAIVSGGKTYYYSRGELYYDKKCEGITVSGAERMGFLGKVKGDLDNVASQGGKLAIRLNTLVKSDNVHTIVEIKEGSSSNSGGGSEEGQTTGSTTYYNRTSKEYHKTSDSEKEFISSLVHELLGHGWSKDRGDYPKDVKTALGTNNQEQINAINIQNVYRKKVGIDLRKTDIDKFGNEYNISNFLDLDASNK
jgi:RHS repeat-associated protein